MCNSSSFSVCCEQPSHLGPPVAEIWACIVTTDYHYSADIPPSDKKRSMVKEELTWIWTSSGLLANCSIKRFRELVQKATSPASILNCSLSKSIWSAIVVPVCNPIQWQRLNIGCGNEQAHLPWSFILCPEPKNPPGFRKFKKVEFHQTKDWVPFAMPRERRKQWSENDMCFVNSSKTMTPMRKIDFVNSTGIYGRRG